MLTLNDLKSGFVLAEYTALLAQSSEAEFSGFLQSAEEQVSLDFRTPEANLTQFHNNMAIQLAVYYIHKKFGGVSEQEQQWFEAYERRVRAQEESTEVQDITPPEPVPGRRVFTRGCI